MTDEIYPLTVPKWGIEMQQGTVAEWHVEQGETVAAGDELIDIETDKIINTLEAPAAGVLRRCIAAKGETLKVGALLGVIAPPTLDEGAINAFIAAFEPARTAGESDEQAGTEMPQTSEPAVRSPAATVDSGAATSRRVRVSPAAAQRARELGVDIGKVTSSGRRISPRDVERYAQQQGARASDSGEGSVSGEPAYEAQPLSATRKTIARKLVEAKQQIPHFYLSIDIEMTAALQHADEISAPEPDKLSLNDIVMRAVVLSLQAVPAVNIHLVDDEIRRFRHVNLALAVATDRGVITPVVRQAEVLSLAELARSARELGERARQGTLIKEDLEAGTFTVTNLGMYGIREFQAVINPPQGAILALGACTERVVPDADGIRMAKIMYVTLSCDHRAIDGALGAQFLQKLKDALEQPADL